MPYLPTPPCLGECALRPSPATTAPASLPAPVGARQGEDTRTNQQGLCASSRIRFDAGDRLVAPLFALSCAFLWRDTCQRLRRFVQTSMEVAHNGFVTGATLTAHAVCAFRRSDVHSLSVWTRLVAVCVAASVDRLSVSSTCAADSQRKHHLLPHVVPSFPKLGSLA